MLGNPSYLINGLGFYCTCSACPEQYDVYSGDTLVGYVRLRWGYLYCEVPDVGGKQVYGYEYDNDFLGCFDTEEERIFHLNEIANKIKNTLPTF